ncbi:MAG: hypothetical protein BJBARM5_0457 [Candidatus Parvarchaeum acidophilus ARMAN-5]|jgi:hypothetical protein|uniref:Phage metallopeptidase domain-containing protein n=1 Tax=Candidatus Parvarchaeum acidophilus ARMAN-5 TaxID=662762 RepID=D6GVE5_PARA5|nr:MAG: hypothetical protein BJBARM5_0457 [Candidatus Parvarchaeum acidophilus ARMAN-5]
MEIAGNDECIEFLKDCMRVFPTFRGAYINIGYNDMPKKVLGRVNAEIEITRRRRFYGLLRTHSSLSLSRKVKNREFYIRINLLFTEIKDEKLRADVVKSIIVHELLHIERNDLIESSKNYGRRKHKKIHGALDKEALIRLNSLRKLDGLPVLDKKNYIEDEISALLSESEFIKKD